MASELPIQASSGAHKSAPIGPSGTPGPAGTRTEKSGITFRAMLDELERKAAELASSTDTVSQPDQLAKAVEGARASLEDALTIKDHLLEAYRQALQQEPRAGESGPQNES